MTWFKERGLQVLSLTVVLLLWQISAHLADLGDTYPTPARVAPDLIELIADGDAFGPLFSTLGRTFAGFALGFTAGIAYGIFTHVWPVFDEYTRGLFNIVLFTPTLIIIFLGLVMLGRTNTTVAVIIGFAIFTEVGVYMRDAFRNFEQDLVVMSTSYKAGALQRTKDMYLPFLVPPMLATSRIGFTLAWKVAFLCEVFGFPDGLGWEVRTSYRIYDMPMLLAWLTLFIVALLVVEQAIRTTEKVVVKW